MEATKQDGKKHNCPAELMKQLNLPRSSLVAIFVVASLAPLEPLE